MTESYFWHLHPDSDETFLGVEGVLILELEHQRVELKPGQMFTVPKGIKHGTSPAGSYSVNLTFERANIETVRTDFASSLRTAGDIPSDGRPIPTPTPTPPRP